MRIKYNILWVDDRKDTFEKAGYDKRIRDYVKGLFLEPQLTICESVEEAKEVLQATTFDVIFSDFNISDSDSEEQGNDFIEYVRGQNVNTEILFYSAMEELPPMHVNRISFFSFAGEKNAYPKLLLQMEKLIDLTVEKLNDLTALRGLVMAETSELDKKMEDICLCYFVEKESEKSNTVFEDILKGLETDYLKNLKKSDICDKKCTHKIRNKKSFKEIITSFSFDSARKARTIKSVIEKEEFSINDNSIATNFYESYLKDIIDTRNLLAHSYSRINKGGSEVLISKKDGLEIVFDEKRIKEIRQRILLYEKMLDDLYNQLIGK